MSAALPSPLPEVFPLAALPQEVSIVEVGPRDGLQNEATALSTATKIEFISRLADAGLTTIEATSFVSPKWVPQLADAAELFPRLPQREGVSYPVLVPNEAGFERALAAGAHSIAIFGSATETFAQKNLASTLAGQFEMFEPVVSAAVARDIPVRGYLSMCFGDPWEGPVPVAQVVATGLRLLSLGCYELSLGDTIGVATPGHVIRLLQEFFTAGVRPDQLAVHFHDTYGQALANTYGALSCGITTIDASAGGLGGCPYAQSATGNLATEDLVWMLSGLGISHGVDLPRLVRTSMWLAQILGRPSPSLVARALSH